MAKGLNFKVIEEGVETESQKEFLKLIDCDEIQGYLISYPLNPEEMQRYLEEKWQVPKKIIGTVL